MVVDIVRKQAGENTRAVHLPAPPTPAQATPSAPAQNDAAPQESQPMNDVLRQLFNRGG